jgi:hypothetical protein
MFVQGHAGSCTLPGVAGITIEKQEKLSSYLKIASLVF